MKMLQGEVLLVGNELCFVGETETGFGVTGAPLKSLLLSAGREDTSKEISERVRVVIILLDGSLPPK